MKTLGCIAAVAAIAGLASGFAQAQPIPVDEIARAHQATKAALDPVLPKKIDNSIVLTGVQIDDVMLTYQYKIDRDRAGFSPEAIDALGRRALVSACSNPTSRKVMEAGGRYGFEFADKFDQVITSVTVGKSDCI